ncbi:MAG TPA: hypothetical protein VGB05_07710, partial [Pyrinomonadaceae bacterium]
HPAKTEVRFRRAAAVTDAVRESVRAALAAGGYVRVTDEQGGREVSFEAAAQDADSQNDLAPGARDEIVSDWNAAGRSSGDEARASSGSGAMRDDSASEGAMRHAQVEQQPRQEAIEFGFTPPSDDELLLASEEFGARAATMPAHAAQGEEKIAAPGGLNASPAAAADELTTRHRAQNESARLTDASDASDANSTSASQSPRAPLPPLNSIAGAMYEVEVESVSNNIRPLYQLEESYIIAVDAEGMLLIDQHAAHERILFDKYRKLEQTRAAESQQLLMPETFDLTPAQAAAFDMVAGELEAYGFSLMRLSGRTVAIKAVPADLPASETRNMLAEILETVEADRRGAARDTLRERVAASLACRAAIKVNVPLAPEKMRWLIDRLLTTSSPTTCPHGRPAILRLTTRDIERGFHRP